MTKTLAAIAFLLVAFAYCGEQDFQDRAGRSCEAKGGDWNGQTCTICRPQKERS